MKGGGTGGRAGGEEAGSCCSGAIYKRRMNKTDVYRHDIVLTILVVYLFFF